MNSNVLKQYLVKIGWDVNTLGYNSVLQKINQLDVSVNKLSSGMAGSFFKAGGIVISTIVSITGAMAKLIDRTAEIDLQTERLARRLYTTEQNARSLSVALDALDMQYEDLFYATEEQYNQFLRLNVLGKQLEAPAALDNTLRDVREIQYEFSRLEMILSYGSRWVVYYLGQMLGVDIESLRNKLAKFNDWLASNIDKVSRKIAEFFEKVYRLFKILVQVGSSLYKVLSSIVNALGFEMPQALGLLSVAFLAIAGGPLGRFILVLSALLLLIEDYMVWTKGGDSLFDWGDAQELFEGINESFGRTIDLVDSIRTKFGDLFGEIDAKQFIMDRLTGFLGLVNGSLDAINILLDLINLALDALDGHIDDLSKKQFFQDLEKFANSWKDAFDFFAKNNLGGGILYGGLVPDVYGNSWFSQGTENAARSSTGETRRNGSFGTKDNVSSGGFKAASINVTVNATTNEPIDTVTEKAIKGSIRGRNYVQNV